MRLAICFAFSMSWTGPTRPVPFSLALACAMASSTSEYLMIGRAGPNCSSATKGSSDDRSAINVGGKKSPRQPRRPADAALALRVVDQPFDLVELHLVGDGAEHGLFPCPDGHLGGIVRQRGADVFVDVLVHIEPLHRGAGLGRCWRSRPQKQPFGDFLGVHIGQHDARIIATQFERQGASWFRQRPSSPSCPCWWSQ